MATVYGYFYPPVNARLPGTRRQPATDDHAVARRPDLLLGSRFQDRDTSSGRLAALPFSTSTTAAAPASAGNTEID